MTILEVTQQDPLLRQARDLTDRAKALRKRARTQKAARQVATARRRYDDAMKRQSTLHQLPLG